MPRTDQDVLELLELEEAHENGTLPAKFQRSTMGYTSEAGFLPGEDREAFDAFRDALIDDLAPEGATEHLLADQVVVHAWRLRRFVAADCGLFGEAIRSAVEGKGGVDHIANVGPKLAKYEGSISRSFFRSLSALKVLQAARTGASIPAVRSLPCTQRASRTKDDS